MNPMKNRLACIFRSVVNYFRAPYRISAEHPFDPEQLGKAFAQMMTNPETRRLIANSLASVFPI